MGAAIALDHGRVATTALAAHVGSRVKLSGWLQQQRKMGQMLFVIVRDGEGCTPFFAEIWQDDGLGGYY